MQMLDRALLGAAYYYEDLPCERLDKDIEMMLHAGINVVRIGESAWSCYEQSDGVFNFSGLEKIVDAMGTAGISVIIGTPTSVLPAWLVRRQPGILAAGKESRGKTRLHQSIDILNPDFRFYAERIIREMLKRVKDKRAVIGYQAGSGLEYSNNYGEFAQKGFAQYLKDKFETTGKLNAALGLNCGSGRVNSWDDIGAADLCADMGINCEYLKYLRAEAADYLEWEAEIINEYKRPDQFVTHGFCFEQDSSGTVGINAGVDPAGASKCLDTAGAAVFHPSQDRLTGAETAFAGDFARSLKHDNYLILETQAQGLPEWTPYPGQLRLQAFAHFASGADMVEYWPWSPVQNGPDCRWKGLLGQDSASNPVYEEAVAVGADLRRIGPHIINLKKKNDFAFAASSDALSAFNANSDVLGTSYGSAMRLMYDAAYRLNLESDFANADFADIKHYKVIFVPALYAASDQMLEKLNSYVREGGCLIAGFCSGFADENARIRRGAQPGILGQACGISCSQSVKGEGVPLAVSGSTRASAAVAASLGSKIGDFVSGAFLRVEGPFGISQDDNHIDGWMELLNSEGAELLARYDHPVWGKYGAVSLNHFGKGWAAYIGCMCTPQLMEGIIKTILVKTGIRTRFDPWPVIRRNGINAFGRPLHYYLNYSSKSASVPYEGGAGKEILASRNLSPDEIIELEPWGVRIVEENQR